VLAVALLLAVPRAPLAAAAPTAPPAPFLRLADEHVEASDDLSWSIGFRIVNPTAGGLYPDSLWLAVEDLGAGQTRAERVRRTDLTFLLRVAGAVAAGDSAMLVYEGMATAERARLTLTLHAHGADGARRVLERTFEAGPGPGFAAHPSRTLTVQGRAVETVFVPAAGAAGPAPGVLLVHGHASHARLMLPVAHQLARRGLAVMLVSQPGYGTSAGPADLGGPATVAALGAALDALAREPGVDGGRLGAWGLSRGAGPLLALAATRPELRALVLQSGIYDLWAVHRGTALAGFPETIVAEAGRDSAAWRARSPLLAAARVRAAVLVMHGEKDTHVPAAQAHALAAALEATGRTVEPHFMPAGHVLAAGQAQRHAFEFLTRHTAAP
jgi:dipeptidyl aminopeptidase/acylaminoacyl peptidase